MAEGTKQAHVNEMLAALKGENEILREEQQRQKGMLEAVLQQLNNFASTYEQMVIKSGKLVSEEGPSNTKVNTNPLFENNGGIQARSLRLEFPRFDGTDLVQWVLKANQFFSYYDIPDNQKIQIAFFHMEGKALSWYTWLKESNPVTTWDEFTSALEIRLPPPPPKNNNQYQNTNPRFPNNNRKPTIPIQRISPGQMQERRAKGLCYYCDERFQPGHRCNKPKLFLLEGMKIEEIEDEEIDESMAVLNSEEPKNEEEEKGELLGISLHALAGAYAPKTMRIEGVINKISVITLIDTGSTYSFIDPNVARKARLTVEDNNQSINQVG
ncbi:hypothetical protein F0562_010726 [Nyssa sinensis]|uniref:Retrotransposon gag domain-containing protein n=1 Tax=Nyssa sinensis TaxID=561372 RepID=A0A5J4ZZR2_9ASTE|nr:hypothetical protein F0562_010726 [Nyssa sinensis]